MWLPVVIIYGNMRSYHNVYNYVTTPERDPSFLPNGFPGAPRLSRTFTSARSRSSGASRRAAATSSCASLSCDYRFSVISPPP